MEYIKQPDTNPFAPKEVPEGIAETVSKIINEVRSKGDRAVLDFTSEFDEVNREQNQLTDEERQRAIDRVTDEEKRIVNRNIGRIQKFAQAQLESLDDFEISLGNGIVLGQKTIPVERVGAYVPGGEYPLLSSTLMTVVPPIVAGVDSVTVATPPQNDGIPHPAVVYGAEQAGADEIFVIGGAQAIAAMALGTEEVTSIDKLLGPGNAFVTEAKRQLFGTVGVDLLAGPSEILVIADDTADPIVVAADLLAQAEHDRSARPLLVTTSKSVGEDVVQEVERQLKDLKTADIAGAAWETMGTVIVTVDLTEAVDIANQLAVEHVEVHTESPRDLLDDLRNYGTLFLGENSANVFSDKLIGTNHTLPTQRSARYTSGLSVHSVIKIQTYQEVHDAGISELEPWATKQSIIENLEGHAKSSFIRSSTNNLSDYDPSNINLPVDDETGLD